MQRGRRKIRSIALAIVGLCLLGAHSGSEPLAQSSAPMDSHPRQQITIKIRSAKTGLPLWEASPYVFFGRAEPQQLEQSRQLTKLWSDTHVDVTGVSPREVRVWIDFIHRDCRDDSDDIKMRIFDMDGKALERIDVYDLDKILSTGIVAHNYCNARSQKPEPGVLTIYVIPATFKELWDL
jgi:hypothetical protein